MVSGAAPFCQRIGEQENMRKVRLPARSHFMVRKTTMDSGVIGAFEEEKQNEPSTKVAWEPILPHTGPSSRGVSR